MAKWRGEPESRLREGIEITPNTTIPFSQKSNFFLGFFIESPQRSYHHQLLHDVYEYVFSNI